MLNVPWWGWLAIAFGVLIVACMVASELIEDRELRARSDEPDEIDETGAVGAETAPPAAKPEEAPAELPVVVEAATGERRAPRPKRKPGANPKRKKAPERKRKTARGRK